MAAYKLQKRSRSGRRVAVRAERIEWNLPAMVVCFLLACAIWLYIVNFSDKKQDAESDADGTPAVTSTADAENDAEGEAL